MISLETSSIPSFVSSSPSQNLPRAGKSRPVVTVRRLHVTFPKKQMRTAATFSLIAAANQASWPGRECLGQRSRYESSRCASAPRERGKVNLKGGNTISQARSASQLYALENPGKTQGSGFRIFGLSFCAPGSCMIAYKTRRFSSRKAQNSS